MSCDKPYPLIGTSDDCSVMDLGVMGYTPALELQHQLHEALISAKRSGDHSAVGTVLLVEHPPVFTLGKHGSPGNLLRRLPGVDVVNIDRGGDITFHGPGQLVAYPIIDLERYHLGVKRYVDLLEQVVIDLLAHYGIAAGRVEGATGVWIGIGTPMERKICAIGIRCSRFVTMHGLALNVSTDLNYFNAINPCGFTDRGVTSMERELGFAPPMDEVKTIFSRLLLNALTAARRAS